MAFHFSKFQISLFEIENYFLFHFLLCIVSVNNIFFKLKINNSVATPESWARFTEDNIKRSAAERMQSDEYINVADNLLKETASDMWNQYNTVNDAFEQRIHETNDAKDKIQNHLSAVSWKFLRRT